MGDDWFELSPKFSASKIGGSTHVLPWFRRKDSELERKFGASWPLNELHLVTTRVFAEHNEAFQRIHSDHDRWYSKSSDSPLRWRKPLYTCPWACRLWARNQNIWCTGQDMKMGRESRKTICFFLRWTTCEKLPELGRGNLVSSGGFQAHNESTKGTVTYANKIM